MNLFLVDVINRNPSDIDFIVNVKVFCQSLFENISGSISHLQNTSGSMSFGEYLRVWEIVSVGALCDRHRGMSGYIRDAFHLGWE